MSNQLCIPTGETCVDCSEYTAAFSCLPKIKVSDMAELSKLDTIALLDKKCADIIFPVTTLDCEEGPKSFSLSLKDLLDIIEHTSIGERKSFPDKEFTAEGQIEEYELTVFNPSETRDMHVSYFSQWSAYSAVHNGELEIESNTYIDGENITRDEGYNTTILNYNDAITSSDSGSTPAFYTKIIGPKEYTTIKLVLECTAFPTDTESTEPILQAETIQLMITGTTR